MDGTGDTDWQPYTPRSLFGRLMGPMERSDGPNGPLYRVRIAPHHTNEAGFLHGGAITAMIDEIVGTMLKEQHGRDHVTVQLTTAFLAPAKVGDYLHPTLEVVRTTRSLVFVESKLLVAGTAVASASLIFKLRPGPAPT